MGTAWRFREAIAILLTAVIVSSAMMACNAEEGFSTVSLATKDSAVSALVFSSDSARIETLGRSNEVQAAVYYPTSWTAQRPRIAHILHGGHTTCADAGDPWPCASKSQRTPSYQGYGYLAEALVGAGYVVVAPSVNATIGSADVEVAGAVINYYNALLSAAAANEQAPLGGVFKDHLDTSSVVVIGHSRGGDAVAVLSSDSPPVPPSVPISHAVLIAPVVPVTYKADKTGIRAGSIATLVLTGTCDGDAGLDGEEFMPALKSLESTLLLVAGANHNFYNTVWTPETGVPDATDDATMLPDSSGCLAAAPGRLSAQEQRDEAACVILDFLSM